MGTMFSFVTPEDTKSNSRVTWESRYEGALYVAVVDKVPVAGISGPWPDGNYALTWWSSRDQETAPSLEFYTSLEIARTRVEELASCPAKVVCAA